MKSLFHYDDALEVVGVHMTAGLIGVVLVGVFASLAVNPAGVASGWPQLGRQTVLAIVAFAYPFVLTWIVLWDKVVGLQVGPGEQAEGLDLGEHGEVGYELDASRSPDSRIIQVRSQRITRWFYRHLAADEQRTRQVIADFLAALAARRVERLHATRAMASRPCARVGWPSRPGPGSGSGRSPALQPLIRTGWSVLEAVDVLPGQS